MRSLTIAIALTLIASNAMAQMAQGGWSTQRFGNQTSTTGTGSNMGWYGSSQDFGNMTSSTLHGPQGQYQTCTTQRFGNQESTTCR